MRIFRKKRSYIIPLISDHVAAAVMELPEKERDRILHRAADIAYWRIQHVQSGGDPFDVPSKDWVRIN
jgi:hypothetical protein